jgi:folate-dependent phosphoribosylglycinamide formyltransferase PurN
MSNKPALEEYEEVLSQYDNPLITLHGWLRVLPEEITNKYEIYNGHPGLITIYPDLKGKDPQVKAWEANYKTIGSVIHRVTAGVDEGPVVLERAYNSDKLLSLDDTFRILHNISTDLWIKFLKERLW